MIQSLISLMVSVDVKHHVFAVIGGSGVIIVES